MSRTGEGVKWLVIEAFQSWCNASTYYTSHPRLADEDNEDEETLETVDDVKDDDLPASVCLAIAPVDQ